jgi:Domain of unknown function (DUF5615)
MKVRFQADADLNQIILLATIRRQPEIDFQTAHSAGLIRLNDLQVLERAANDHRLLVTHDRKTMPRYFAEFIGSKTSGGLLIVPQSLSVSHVVDDLILIWSTTEQEEWLNRISVLPL